MAATDPDYALLAMTDETAARCRTLLPDAFPVVGRAPDCVVAVERGEVVGAGAMAWLPDGFPVMIAVAPHARRRGIGRALLCALRERACGETPGLKSWSPVAADSATAHLMMAEGFVVHRRLHVFEAEPTAFGNAMTALLTRLRPRVPTGATLVRPSDVTIDALASLLAGQFALREDLLANALQGDAVLWEEGFSRVLLVDGEVAGAIVARRIDAGIEVDFNTVLPRWRGGWANVMLIEALVRHARAAGVTLIRFLAEPHVHDTANLSRRAGGVRRADQVTLSLPF